MSLFVDKYSLEKFPKIAFHEKESNLLSTISDDVSIPHLIFYGPSGSGKKTLVRAYMEKMYDKNVHHFCDTPYKVNGSGSTVTKVNIKQSNYHIIIEPNNNNFDKYLIQDVVKYYAKTPPHFLFTKRKPFKIVLINNIEKLSYYAQTSLRRTMEKYSKICRFIMICNSLSSVIDPIRSRCYCFRVDVPSNTEIMSLMTHIVYKEKIPMTLDDYVNIMSLANGNIKKIMLSLQLRHIGENYDISYNESIKKIFSKLLTCDIDEILKIRLLIWNMTITTVQGIQILRDLFEIMLISDKVDELSKIEITEAAALYSYNLTRYRREIIHLEAFIATAMYVLSKM